MIKVLASGSKGNGYLVVAGEEKLILELGIPFKEMLKAIDFNLEGVVGALISHKHLPRPFTSHRTSRKAWFKCLL
ncbi:metallo-beta-lactamase domain protein [Clostridium perfringens]|uniref:Metallo-beta-lactamase domain protein n=1 Tax=Clostridium perfringens TaxID=1502 RepID=A0A2X3IGT0_CLOPF|nr:metallo-beta-lactamase domain protein [Clostridium perfringens]